jgi:serine/threonine-protein kinase
MELQSGHIIEDYEITEKIGEGAMGKVYLAKNNNTRYAIKESDAECSTADEKTISRACLREAELLSKINHPAIPKFYKSFKYNEKFYLVMEYVKGPSMEKIINNRNMPLEEKYVLEWAIQLCEIFFYLHTLSPEPVIYRDLKPSNIIITEENILRLIDFGVARRYDPDKDSDTVRLGTPGYAAPEQCRKRGQSIPASDIYATGVVLHQLLTLYDPSVTPFRLPSIRNLNPSVSEQLEWIIAKAINLDSKDRYVDAGLFRDELLEYYEENFGNFTFPYKKYLPYMKNVTSSIKTITPEKKIPFTISDILVYMFTALLNVAIIIIPVYIKLRGEYFPKIPGHHSDFFMITVIFIALLMFISLLLIPVLIIYIENMS